ncbi:phosphoribosyl 1,2-cyclic phosphate phosphodiesterase [Sphingomonas naasensis]|uniref:MBL fold metallo-hydrolase n=1 Tax=Sphingomonas naasensis TaxID=1344951 RepID=A0A4S1WRR4_9SPHN|nr:MBL fold metallo-hydrolase [Sphingomonas naasensis]NIJ18429.1 phosphoribosyl 1,2-cyclic phosphate phosphodiesterase [Sphingomonas naasensis]TGX45693.1 MBL fold metallo-hydrolase [Sphingomonas naasensis]
MKIRILGSGTSSGVPRIGNDWGQCDPEEPRNRRTRASVIVSTDTTTILIDTSPDMRAQLLAAEVSNVDAVIWTHDHADHTHGIDDLRQLMHIRNGEPVRGLARPFTLEQLQIKFPYAFFGRKLYRPSIAIAPLPDELTIGDIRISVADQPHGGITSAGLRFENAGKAIGYATDFHEMTDAMRALYTGLDIWVVDALRRAPHPTHPHLASVLQWIGELAPRRSALVHMDQSMDYMRLAAELPAGVEPGYDGLEMPA